MISESRRQKIEGREGIESPDGEARGALQGELTYEVK